MESNTVYDLRLIRINCYQNDENNGDDLFLKYNNKIIFPADKKSLLAKEGTYDIMIHLKIPLLRTNVKIELWDYDHVSRNDKLGEFNMLIDGIGQNYTTDLTSSYPHKAKYSIEWEVYKSLIKQ